MVHELYNCIETTERGNDTSPVRALRRWALIRDENVAKRANDYVQNSIMGASRDTQLRMLGIVKIMLANLHGKEDIFAFGHDVMRTRWRRLNAVVSRSRRISLQRMAPEYCTYFKRIREPSPGQQQLNFFYIYIASQSIFY